MVKNSYKKLVAAMIAASMLSASFVPMASAVMLDTPVKTGVGTFVEAKSLDDDGTIDGTITTTVSAENNKGYEKVATAASAWAIGQKLTFDMTINAATSDSGAAKNDFNGLSIYFPSTNSSKTGPAMTFAFTLPDATDTTKGTAAITWKGSGSGPQGLTGSLEIGKKYTFLFDYVASNSISLTVMDEDGKAVVTATGLPTRTATEAGDTLAGITLTMNAREAGKEASVTMSDAVYYTGTAADEIDVTATGVVLTEGGEETSDLVLANNGNDAIYIPSSGGSFDLASVVKQEGSEVEGYEVVYELEDAPNGVTIDGSTISVSAVTEAGTLNPTLVVYTTKDTAAKAKIELNIVKADASAQEYVDAFAETLKIQDLDGKDIKKTGSLYIFEKGFTVYEGDGVAEIEWSVFQETDDEDEPWEESDIISTKTGKYTPVENFDGKIKLVATITYKGDDEAVATKEFICKVSDSEAEVAADVEYVETMIDWDDNVISDLDLPSYGPYGSTIIWESSNPSVISTKGDVSRPSENKTVRLTATVEKGNESEEITFTVTVTKKRSSNGGGGLSSGSGYVSQSSIIDIVNPTQATPAPVATPTPTPVVTFTDLDSVEWAKPAITTLAARKVINGRTATTFAPNDDITRAEFAKILINAFGLVTPGSTVTGLSDVTDSSAWYYAPIASAYNKGIITGYADGTFGVNDKVTRQDMAVMVYRAAKAANISINVMAAEVNFEDADQIADYAKEAVTALQRAGIINGVSDTEFAPTATATRAQAAKIIYGVTK